MPSIRRLMSLAFLACSSVVASAAAGADCQPLFRRGDLNGDGARDLTDGLRILGHLFLGAPATACADAADTDDDGRLILTDAIFLLDFLFLGGPAPPAPGSECGLDPTPDSLACAGSPGCPGAGRADDPEDCGRCRLRCADLSGPHVTLLGCENGQCFVRRCEEGFADADGLVENGCEARSLQDSSPAWLLHIGGIYHDANSCSIEALPDGSVWFAGTVSTLAEVAGNEPACPREIGNASPGVLLARYDPTGRVVWTRFAAGRGREVGDLTLLSDGSAFVTGSFASEAVFGTGEPNETTVLSRGEKDFFLARYAAGGNLAWVRAAGGSHLAGGGAVAALPDGSTFASGGFIGDLVLGEGEPNETRLTAVDPPRHENRWQVGDSFLARFSAAGSLLWVSHIGDVHADSVHGLRALPDGSVAVAGSFWERVTFRARDRTVSLTAHEQSDGFLARYFADGSLAWVSQIETTGQGYPFDLATKADGSILLLGGITANRPEATFDPGGPRQTTIRASDTFLAAYAVGGSFLWARGIAAGYVLAVLPDDSALVTGSVDAPTLFGANGPKETLLDPLGPVNLFTARFDAAGDFSWARLAPSEGYQVPHDAAVLADGSLFVAGRFSYSMLLFAGEPLETRLESDSTLFLARLAGPRLTAGNVRFCSGEDRDGGCPAGQACAEGTCTPACAPDRFPCGPGIAHSDLPGVRIEFPAQPCQFTLSEVAAGIELLYEVVVDQDLPGVRSTPSAAEGCGALGPESNLSVREEISGGGQSYCLCDMGLCGIRWPPDPRDLRQGTYPARFPWDGQNWIGPSDFFNRPGPPFPPGQYTFQVRAEGTFESHAGDAPFEVVGRFGIELMPD